MKHGFDNKYEPREGPVENPYQKGEYEKVTRNTRESSLATMLARKQIDEAQYRAGEWLERQFNRARLGADAVDPSNEPVDVSTRSDPTPDRVVYAAQQIAQARKEVGGSFNILVKVCVEGYNIKVIADQYGNNPRTIGRLFRGGLEQLAIFLGFAPKNTKEKIEKKY